MTIRFRGIIAPVTTPFDPRSGDLSVGALEANIRAHLAAGMSGILVAGSTGEAALLDERERAILMETAREVVPADRLLLVGIGAESTRQTVQRARDAGSRGLDGVLVVSPHYYTAAMTESAVLSHFSRVADDSPLPVMLYNIPKYVHFPIPPHVVGKLAEHANVVGIKDSSGDLAQLGGFLQAQSPSFTVLTGNGPTWCEALEAGARAGILAAALFAPRLCLEVLAAAEGGDWSAARRVQSRLRDPAREIVGTLGVPGVKAAVDLVGLVGGPVRSPLQSLGPEGRDKVAAYLRGLASPAATLDTAVPASVA